jgi:hypothetical protein
MDTMFSPKETIPITQFDGPSQQTWQTSGEYGNDLNQKNLDGEMSFLA